MKTNSVYNHPWLITHAGHQAIRCLYRTHCEAGEFALVGPKKKNPAQTPRADVTLYETKKGTAIVNLTGVLVKNQNNLSWLFDGTAMRDTGEAVRAAMEDPAVNAILLYIDSPGGTVDGTEELANLINAARGRKPIIVYSDGMTCSAAYWIASAADKIIISGDTVQVGSIGCCAAHIDISKQDEMYGEKITEITAGKYKRIAGNHAPLSDEGRAYLQEQVDNIYSIFIKSVAKNRNISERKALLMADGKIFLGQQAVDVGLVDGIARFEDVLRICANPEIKPLAISTQNKNAGNNFEAIVFAHCKRGASQQQAFGKTKENYPELYQDWTARLKTGKVEAMFPGAVIGNRVIK